MEMELQPVDLDGDTDWSFADLRRPVVPAELPYSPEWQESRRRARAERDAARAVARRQAVEHSVAEAAARVAARQAQKVGGNLPPTMTTTAGVNVAQRPVQQPVQPVSVEGHPRPPAGRLLRYARIGADTVALVEERLNSGVWRFTIWAHVDGRWRWCGHDLTESEARRQAADVAALLLQGDSQ